MHIHVIRIYIDIVKKRQIAMNLNVLGYYDQQLLMNWSIYTSTNV